MSSQQASWQCLTLKLFAACQPTEQHHRDINFKMQALKKNQVNFKYLHHFT